MRIENKTVKIILCSILFQVYWFMLVWSAGRDVSIYLSVLCIILSVIQLAVLARPLRLSVVYLLAGMLIGGAMDSVLTALGVHNPARVIMPAPLVPLWLVGLWAAFLVYIRTGLVMMSGRYFTQFAAGFICGPLAWVGGSKMGAVTVNENLLVGYGVMAVCWGLICIVLFKLSDVLKVKQ